MKGGKGAVSVQSLQQENGERRRGAGGTAGELLPPLAPRLVGTSDRHQTPALSCMSCAGAGAFSHYRIPSHPIPSPGPRLCTRCFSPRAGSVTVLRTAGLTARGLQHPSPLLPSPLPAGTGRGAWPCSTCHLSPGPAVSPTG